MSVIVVLGLIAIALFGYSFYVQYTKPSNEPTPMRIVTAFAGACTALGALVTQFFNQ